MATRIYGFSGARRARKLELEKPENILFSFGVNKLSFLLLVLLLRFSPSILDFWASCCCCCWCAFTLYLCVSVGSLCVLSGRESVCEKVWEPFDVNYCLKKRLLFVESEFKRWPEQTDTCLAPLTTTVTHREWKWGKEPKSNSVFKRRFCVCFGNFKSEQRNRDW